MQNATNTAPKKLYKVGQCFADLIRKRKPATENRSEWGIHEVVSKWRRLKKALTVHGNLVTRYQTVEAKSYINLVTGEIVLAANMASVKLGIAGYVGEKARSRIDSIENLRPEVKSFAKFCLKFRNKRRGVTPGFDKLCHWYALVADKRADNIRRMLPKLKEIGLIAGDSLLGPEWQVAGRNTVAKDHMNEDAVAACTLGVEMLKRGGEITAAAQRLTAEITGMLSSAPHWAEVAMAEREVALAWGAPDESAHEPVVAPMTDAALMRAIEFLIAHKHVLSGKDNE